MASKFITRVLDSVLRLYDDFVWLFHRRRLMVVAWCKFNGAKLRHNNWGDDINVSFLESVTKHKIKVRNASPLFSFFPHEAFSCIGSIIGMEYTNNTEVWGSGLLRQNKEIKQKPNKIFSVRGPLTRNELLNRGIECPERYGDPALLISRYFKPSPQKRYDLGIIPHYTDEDNPILLLFCKLHPEVLVIKMRGYNDWHDIPTDICSCKRIISSSLHGLIMADSYRVPNIWVSIGKRITGGDFKYQDYFLSVGRKVSTVFCINSVEDIENIINNNCFSIARYDKIDYCDIYNACPFKDKMIDFRDLIPPIPQYNSFSEKEKYFYANEYINSERELDYLINKLLMQGHSFLFRGVRDARYKMYTSSQRHWMQKTEWVYRMGQISYNDFIEEIIRRMKNLREVQQYIKDLNIHPNDCFLFALMHNFGAPSPMIVFTESFMTGLSYASECEDCQWTDTATNDIGDYVSLYYISSCFDSVTKSAQNNESIFSFISLPRGRLDRVDFANDFHYDDSINNHMEGQQGLYIRNNTEDIPLEILMNSRERQPMLGCINIHKKILSYLRKNYLKSNECIYKDSMNNSNGLQEAITALG